MSSDATTLSSYDTLPYASRSLPQTHPDALAVAATLYGLTPAPIEQCRVLELGCANGSNLIPMAATLAGSEFVGIDLSPRQIAEGQGFVSTLGLKNLTLRTADLMTLEESLGSFDYIICHGVYSWVPPAVQTRIMELCARHLSPHGVAYISYNTYPGFHKRQLFREMLQYHTAALTDPLEAARQGRALLEFLLQNTSDENGTYARLLRDELDKVRGLPLSYLFHEHLEEHNHPCYFHEFMARASAHGLQFLAEAEGKGGYDLLPDAAKEALAGLGNDVVRREQYIDFLRNSTLRSTLLCHAARPLDRELIPTQVRDFQVLCVAQPEEPTSDPRGPAPVKFRTKMGSATVEHPMFKSMLLALFTARPRPFTLPQLQARASELVQEPVSTDDVREMVLYGYRMGLVALRTRAPQLAEQISERPCTTALARLQAQLAFGVSNVWHEAIATDPIERQILQRLDGKHDAEALTQAIIALAQDDASYAQLGTIPARENVKEWAPSLVQQVLAHFLVIGLLVV